MGYRKNPVSLDALRELAKQRFQSRQVGHVTALTLDKAEHLFEELEIHQIELELQNEHLNAARAQLEMALNQSSALYDFAPVGILSLDPSAIIVKLNLAGANLLEGDRASLMGSRFGLYVSQADRPVFNELLGRAKDYGDIQDGEISLLSKGPFAAHVQIRIASLPDAGWQMILVDVTERWQIEKSLRANEERWKLALEAAGDGVWDWQVQTGEMLYSRRFEQLFGYAVNEYGHHLDDGRSRIHPDDKPQMTAALQAHLSGESDSYSSVHRMQCKDGSWKWVLSRGAVVSRSEDGKPSRMVGTYADMTSSKKIEEALRVASAFQQAVFDSLSAHIAVLDRQGAILQTNAAWHKFSVDIGLANHPCFMGGDYLEILTCLTGSDQDTVAAASAGIASVISGEVSQFQLPHPFFTPLDKRWFTMKVTPVRDAAERVVVSHEDVTNLKAAELASLTLANMDALTGAMSRRNFLHLAEQERARSKRYELPLMVLMLDLDHFKQINDHYGHAAGDAVLQGFVQCVQGALRESDLIGRLGGEEFAVLLPNTTPDGGQTLAQRIIESVRTSPVDIAGEPVAYTVSIGAGSLTSETHFPALLGLADAALYRAKHGGRNRLEIGPG